MGQSKVKQVALALGRAYIEPKDMRGLMHPCEETPEGDLLVTAGPYKGFKVKVPR